MPEIFFNVVVVAIGVYFGIRNIRLLRDEEALRKYVQTSPKAATLVRKYGVERAMQMLKESNLPFGVLISVVLIGLSAWNLWRIAQ